MWLIASLVDRAGLDHSVEVLAEDQGVLSLAEIM